MGVELNGTLLQALIKARGGVSAFLDAWVEADVDGDESVDRTTVYRWQKGQLPKNHQTLMCLAAVLDVDPFALLTIPPGDIAESADELLEIVQDGVSTPAPLQLLREFFGRRKDWPPPALAADYFKRSWHVEEFVHDPARRSNYYQTVTLLADTSGAQMEPRVYHFAFRQPHAFAARWLQYGAVVRQVQLAKLWHINGHTQSVHLGEAEPLHVQTWFGVGPAIFQVASLHAFTLAVRPADEVGEPSLRFPG